MENKYTSQEIRKIWGSELKQKMMDYLCLKGIIGDKQEGLGSGNRREFSFDEIFDVGIALKLRRFRTEYGWIKRIIKGVHKIFEDISQKEKDMSFNPYRGILKTGKHICLMIYEGLIITIEPITKKPYYLNTSDDKYISLDKNKKKNILSVELTDIYETVKKYRPRGCDGGPGYRQVVY